MILIFIPLLMPAIGLAAPLFLLLNSIRLMDCGGTMALQPFFSCAGTTGTLVFNMRDSLWGVGVAMISGALPFAVWNLKGYLDTIPKELEEAAAIDGANPNQVFFRVVMPLAAPQLAVTFFLGFIGHWQEFAMPWLFLTQPKDYTLAMTLYNMTGQYANAIQAAGWSPDFLFHEKTNDCLFVDSYFSGVLQPRGSRAARFFGLVAECGFL